MIPKKIAWGPLNYSGPKTISFHSEEGQLRQATTPGRATSAAYVTSIDRALAAPLETCYTHTFLERNERN